MEKIEKLKFAYCIADYLYDNNVEWQSEGECEDVHVSSLISYIKRTLSITISIDAIYEIFAFMNSYELENKRIPQLIYDPIHKMNHGIDPIINYKYDYSGLGDLLGYYREEINDPDFFYEYFHIQILNSDPDLPDDDWDDDFDDDFIQSEEDNHGKGGFINNSDDQEDENIDLLEIKKDAWGNLYTEGGRMYDRSVNRNNNDEDY